MPPSVGWGFIGAGGVARRRMLPAARELPEVAISAVMVREQSRAEAIAAEFGARAAYQRVEDLLADAAVEAVYIATPPDVHGEQVVAAAEAGRHILLEKPMALDLPTCDRMLAAVASAGVRLAVCFPLRHAPAVRTLRDWLRAGEFGDLIYLRAQLAKWYPLEAGAWRSDPRQAGGGVVMDLGSHLLDLATWLGGPIRDLGAQIATRVWPVEVEDTAVLTLGFESGAQAILDVSFAVHDSANLIEVYGTEGYALAPSPREPTAIVRVTGEGREEVSVGRANVYAAELLDFTAAVRTGAAAQTSGDDGRQNVACLRAAYRAAARATRERPGEVE
ncbi:MAG: Gfo/Idh/MocA family oxidoreductase [Armatimonadetes bacterium]|nr:Gfo/Idh/MocA family oxidoreductase [Armatimonadota bacterium]